MKRVVTGSVKTVIVPSDRSIKDHSLKDLFQRLLVAQPTVSALGTFNILIKFYFCNVTIIKDYYS